MTLAIVIMMMIFMMIILAPIGIKIKTLRGEMKKLKFLEKLGI